MSRIFISYSSKNSASVEALANDLETLGNHLWFDKELSGGQPWWDEILHGIRECDLFVFALTPQSLDSQPCKLEYTYATALKKHILPVLLAATSTNILPPELSVMQFVDYQQRDANAVLKLGRALASLPAPNALPDPLPTPPEAPISPLAALVVEIDSSDLTLDRQMGIFIQLKGYLSNPDLSADARSLLIRLSDHPKCLAPVFKEIQNALALPIVTGGSPAPAKPRVPPPPPAQKTVQQADKEPPRAPFELAPGEQLLKESSAMLYLNAMSSASGNLSITNRRVVFSSNTKSQVSGLAQTGLGLIGAAQGSFDVPLANITDVTKRMMMVSVPSIRISASTGHEWDIVIRGGALGYGNREEIIQVIQDAKSRL